MGPDGVYAFISFRSVHMADIALQLNGQMLHGRPMKVSSATRRMPSSNPPAAHAAIGARPPSSRPIYACPPLRRRLLLGIGTKDGDENARRARQVVVNGLPSTFGEDDLHQLFAASGQIQRIMFRSTKSPGVQAAVLEFETQEQAIAAVQLGNNTLVDHGQSLQVSLKTKELRGGRPKPASTVPPALACSLSAYFSGASSTNGAVERAICVASTEESLRFRGATLLGHVEALGCGGETAAYLNTHEPWFFVAVGVQGAGKSHTLACLLEGCLIPFKQERIVKLGAPMTALVLHYDMSSASMCEATGLMSPAPKLQQVFNALGNGPAPCVPPERAVILVSPSYLRQRRAFYASNGSCCPVQPLLLRWHTLSANHIKRLMRVKDGDQQLHVVALVNLLRHYQRLGALPNFQAFVREVRQVCNFPGQEGLLAHRLMLLESLVAESAPNSSLIHESSDLEKSCEPGHLVIVDMTDPLLSSEDANAVFQVLVEQYRALPCRSGKVLALDEAHKYMKGDISDGLSAALVKAAQRMRHDGMRLLVSAQSPLALAPELLALVSGAFLHRFHSADWFAYLSKKLPISPVAWRALVELPPGHALLFAARHTLPWTWALEGDADWDRKDDGGRVPLFKLAVRQRITVDWGASRSHSRRQGPRQAPSTPGAHLAQPQSTIPVPPGFEGTFPT